ncbi:hypothetical protein [Arthrobacter pigmenti]
MKKVGGGAIVNISSTAGTVAVVGAPSVAYVGSKFASRGVTKQPCGLSWPWFLRRSAGRGRSGGRRGRCR